MYEDEMSANRRWWDGATPVHYRSRSYDVEGFRRGASSLLPLEVSELGDVAGKRLLHLQCHFGLDTMSWARKGAVVTGVDFSPVAIATARQLSTDLAIPARFIESNVYALPEVLDERFDIVYTGYGALCWLPDLDQWAKIIARFLRPGGTFYIVESHPYTDLIDDEVVDRVALKGDYPSGGRPLRVDSPNTYTDSDGPLEVQTTYEWDHPLSEVLNALISAGLQVEWLHEHPLGFFPRHPLMVRREDGHCVFPDGLCGLPLTFSLRARLPS